MRASVSGSWRCLPFCCLILLAGCGTTQTGGVVRDAAGSPSTTVPLPTLEALLSRELAPDDGLLIGAGDIAECGRQLRHAKETAAIIQKFPTATVFAAGDDAYRNGTTEQFSDCYNESWGPFKARTRPAPGNHDYGIYLHTPRNNADPYFAYFGANAGTAGQGFYSYDLGGWHIVSLNSMAGQTGAPSMADQVAWLRNDLANTEKSCILAYWHHPLFSSGAQHGDQTDDPGRFMTPLWDVLLEHKADVILNGHDHHYERFALQDTTRTATAQGIRQFVVGTGGGDRRGLGTVKQNSEVRLPNVYGVLLMTLHPNSYEWHFINADGIVQDGSSESQPCH